MGSKGFETARVPTSIALSQPREDYVFEDPYGMTPYETPYGPPAPMGMSTPMFGDMYPQAPMPPQQPAPMGPPQMNNPQAAYGPAVMPPVSPLAPGQPAPGPYSQPKSGLIANFMQERGITPQQFAWNVALGMTGVTNPQAMFQNFFQQQQLRQRNELMRQQQAVRNEDKQYRRQYQQQTARDRQEWTFNKEMTKLADRLGSINAWDDYVQELGRIPETPEDLRRGTQFYAEAKGRFDKVQRRNKTLGAKLNTGWKTGMPASIAADSEFANDAEAQEQLALINEIISARKQRMDEMDSLKKQLAGARTRLMKKQAAGKLTDQEKFALDMLKQDFQRAQQTQRRAQTALSDEELADMQLWEGKISALEDMEMEAWDVMRNTLTAIQAAGIPIGDVGGVRGEVYTPTRAPATTPTPERNAPPVEEEEDLVDRYFNSPG